MENKNQTRGRNADRPSDIPGRGWKDVLIRVKNEFSNDHLDIVSAGVAFYFFLALFPLLAAMIAIYGLVFDPAQVEQHMSQLTAFLPAQAHNIISERLHTVAQTSGEGLGIALVISILLSLWSGNQGTKALFEGVNIAYNQKNERGFFKYNAITLGITLGAIIIGIICAALVVGFPALIGNLGLPETLSTVISLVRWPVLFLIVILSIAVLYKIAPDRDNPKFRWVSWGAAIGTFLWIAGSLLFSLYVNNFGDYNATYGSVAAVIILMLWFQLTSICILLGAEINSELEHQTAKDTTVGPSEPLGKRKAYHADHVAQEPESSEEEPQKTAGRDRESVRRERNYRGNQERSKRQK